MPNAAKSERKLHMPTQAEDLAIQQGIADDPDASELGDDFFRHARPAVEVLGASVVEALTSRSSSSGAAGPGAAPAAVGRVVISLQLDQDVLDALRAMGADWQTRVNELLRAGLAASRHRHPG